jgi:shikimate kinase
MTRIFLIGFMGAGKTTIGKLLGELLRIPFLDLDDYIVDKEKKTISQIFELEGETIFREKEHQYLLELKSYFPSIVAVGGGTPCYHDNMDWMNLNGVTVYLEVPIKTLIHRLNSNKSHRPVLAEVGNEDLTKEVQTLIESRRPYYEKAHFLYKSEESETEVASELASYFLRYL